MVKVEINTLGQMFPFKNKMQKIIFRAACDTLEKISKDSFHEKNEIEKVEIAQNTKKPMYRTGGTKRKPKYCARNSSIRNDSNAFTAVSKIKFITVNSLCNS